MADLTQQDKDNYQEVREAFQKIADPLGKDQIYKDVSALLSPLDPKHTNTTELSKRIKPLNLYLKIQFALGKELLFSGPSAEQEKLRQQLFDSLEALNISLSVFEDNILDLTDGIENNSFDSLFLETIKKINPSAEKSTRILLNGGSFNLSKSEINKLVQAWGTATHLFVEDARKKDTTKDQVVPLQPTTLAHFFQIHNTLENLYTNLADTEIFQTSR